MTSGDVSQASAREPIVLLEDNHVLIVFKPPGVLTQRAEPTDDSMLERARALIKRRDEKPGNVYLGLVHRLDRPVSGLLILAKTSKAAARLSAQIRERRVKKIYRALVEGSPPKDRERLEHFLSATDDFGARVHDRPGPERQLARLSYEVLRRDGELSHLEIVLETGRKHQIRAQLAHIGCPIVGDQRYGARTPFLEGGLALVSHRLQLDHPVRDEPIDITLPAALSPLSRYLGRRPLTAAPPRNGKA